MMKMTGEVCSDDENIGQVGFRRRPNQQIENVGWPQSIISSNSDGNRLRLASVYALPGKCRFIISQRSISLLTFSYIEASK